MLNINSTEILQWYEKNKRDLPWRYVGISAYAVWVSEIMLQQTQVSRGIIFYERFLKKFPNVKKLAKANWQEFLPYYEGLGYYNRGRNMLETAKIIVRDFGGEFPEDKTQLVKLPGIGEYTASAILSFAYQLPYVAFDTNFRKIFGTKEEAEKAFKISGVSSSVFNSAVMDYASAHREIKKKSKKEKRVITKAVVVLHENHKKYFSKSLVGYKPFIMPKGIFSRETIKKYFLETYGLSVSVRPLSKTGLVNVQILSGNQTFAIYSKNDYDIYHDKIT